MIEDSDLPEDVQRAITKLVVSLSELFDDSFSEDDKSDIWDLLKKESFLSTDLSQTDGDESIRDMLSDLVPQCKTGRKARYVGRFYYTKEEEGAKPIVGTCIPFVSCCAGCAIWKMHKKISPMAVAGCPSDSYISGIYVEEKEIMHIGEDD